MLTCYFHSSTDGFKNDLEARISQHLAQNQNYLQGDSRFASLYKGIVSSPGPASSAGSRRRSIVVKKTPLYVLPCRYVALSVTDRITGHLRKGNFFYPLRL